MKLSSWILRISLIAMVLLSFVFSWLIWRNPSRLERRNTSTVQLTRLNEESDATLQSRVYLPTRAYYQTKGEKQMLFAENVSVVNELHQLLKKWQPEKVTALGKESVTSYQKLVAKDDTLQLLYNNAMSFRYFDRWFFTKALKYSGSDFTFDRIVIHMDKGSKQILLVNDQTREVHQLTLTSTDQASLLKAIQKYANGKFPVIEKQLKNRQVAFYTRPVSLQPYAYLMDHQSPNFYVSLLMPTKVANNVDAREIGDSTLYTAGASHRMTADTKTGLIQYENLTATQPSAGLAAQLKAGFSGLQQLQLTNLTSMRYFETNLSRGSTTYKTYLQGLPIFNEQGHGDVTVRYGQAAEEINFSSENLTVPIPTRQTAVTLPATQTVIDQLVAAGYQENTITDVTVGYSWHDASNDQQVVDLQPVYFVAINGTYHDTDTWLSLASSGQSQTAQSQEGE